MEQDNLRGKNVLVVGGGTGIGKAVAIHLATSGCKCAISGRRLEKLVSASEESPTENRILFQGVDVTDRQSVSKLFAWFGQEVGDIDILVYAAGINIKNRTMSAMSPEEWDQVMAINATGAYNCLNAVLPGMRKRKEGLVINISSIAGKRALALGGVAYAASKFAMTALGTAAGHEEAEHGIRITNVYPGEVDTPLMEQRSTPVTAEHRATMLRPADIAELVVSICALPSRVHVPEVVVKPLHQEFI